MPQGNTNNTETQETYLNYLNNYFGGKDKDGKEIKPICREERQYALFLYNKLLSLATKNVYDKLDIEFLKQIGFSESDKIFRVYYEATFMRDFLYQEDKKKSKFNKKLYEYVLDRFFEFDKEGINIADLSSMINPDKLKSILDKKEEEEEEDKDKKQYKVFPSRKYNFWENNVDNIYKELNNYVAIPEINYCSQAKDGIDNGKKENVLPYFIRKLMSAMMNSKADLGIIYQKENDKKMYLKFIECKYLSREGYTSLLDGINVEKNDVKIKTFENYPFILKQTYIQYFICEFICEKLFEANIKADFPLLLTFKIHDNNSEKEELGEHFFYIERIKVEKKQINIKDLIPKSFGVKLL